jgi:hypothetical protein
MKSFIIKNKDQHHSIFVLYNSSAGNEKRKVLLCTQLIITPWRQTHPSREKNRYPLHMIWRPVPDRKRNPVVTLTCSHSLNTPRYSSSIHTRWHKNKIPANTRRWFDRRSHRMIFPHKCESNALSYSPDFPGMNHKLYIFRTLKVVHIQT